MRKNGIHLFTVIFGLLLILSGLNHLLHIIPQPEHKLAAKEFIFALEKSGYIFPTTSLIMILAGSCLMINRLLLPALILLMPISFNIFAFHVFLEPEGMTPGLIIFGINLFLLIQVVFKRNQCNQGEQ